MDAQQLVQQGFQLLGSGQLAEAARVSAQALQKAPKSGPALLLAAEAALARESFEEALKHIDAAIAAEPMNPARVFRKAQILLAMRRGLDAQSLVADYANSRADDFVAQGMAALIFRDCENHAGGTPFFSRLRELGSDDLTLRFAEAQNLFFLGALDKAEVVAGEVLERSPGFGQAHLLRARSRKQTAERNHVVELEALRSQSMPPIEGAMVRYALAKELEDLGRYSESFTVLKEGADMRRQTLSYQPDQELRNLSDMSSTFTSAALDQTAPGAPSDAPIFVVGLPRTGTTLVERILASNKEVSLHGESNDFPRAMSECVNQYIVAHPYDGLNPLTAALRVDFRQMGQSYLGYVAGMIGPAKRFVDKTPFNALYSGLINRALPNAAIIHLKREPMDACFAIYKTFFNQAYSYSYDLNELGDYYVAHHRLMAHWQSVLGDKMLTLEYEKLVSDPERESKRIMEFCRLPWTPDVLRIEDLRAHSSTASAAQVRQPIYTSSVGNWRHYERELAPLREKLSAAGLV